MTVMENLMEGIVAGLWRVKRRAWVKEECLLWEEMAWVKSLEVEICEAQEGGIFANMKGLQDEKGDRKLVWIQVVEEFTFILLLIGYPWKQNVLVGEERRAMRSVQERIKYRR